MAYTAYVDGITIVSAAWLNAMNTHIHDGVADDGHAPKVDIFNHATYGTNGVIEQILDTPTNYVLQIRNNNNNPDNAHILFPGLTVQGSLDVFDGITASGDTFTSGIFQFGTLPKINVDKQSVLWTKGKILWTAAGAISKFHSKNFDIPTQSGQVITVPFIDTLDYPPNISIDIEFAGTFSGGHHYKAYIKTNADPLNKLEFMVLKITSSTVFLDNISPPLEDLIFNIIVS